MNQYRSSSFDLLHIFREWLLSVKVTKIWWWLTVEQTHGHDKHLTFICVILIIFECECLERELGEIIDRGQYSIFFSTKLYKYVDYLILLLLLWIFFVLSFLCVVGYVLNKHIYKKDLYRPYASVRNFVLFIKYRVSCLFQAVVILLL